MAAARTLGRSLAAAAAAVAALCLGPAAPRAAAPDPAIWRVDEAGRRFRVAFDPGTRWMVGGAWAPGRLGADGGGAAAGAIETALSVRYALPFPEDDVLWKHTHEVLATRLWLGALDATGGAPLVTATLYRGTFLRWQRDGFVTLPTSPPRRLSLPVNIGFDAVVGRFETAPPGTGLAATVGVVRAEVLFDVWRVPRLGSYAQLGIGPAYDIWLPGSWESPSAIGVAHLVTPGSGASFTVHHEWANGRQQVEARVEGAWRWSSHAAWGAAVGALARYEVIWLALNDQPVSAFVETAWRYDALLPADAAHDVRALAGLRFALTLD